MEDKIREGLLELLKDMFMNGDIVIQTEVTSFYEDKSLSTKIYIKDELVAEKESFLNSK